MTGPVGVEVFVLGPLHVRHDGSPVELGPLRRRATFAALAVDVDRTVALDTLLDRVWDGAPPDSAVTAVQAYVSRLRSALTRAGAGDGSASPIVTEHPGYRLAVGPGAFDAARFVAAVTTARQAREAGDLVEAARSVRSGLALWRGDAYADVPTRAARAESDRLAALRASARYLAVELDLALGRHDDVLDEVRELSAASPLAEPLHGLLMLALHRAGRPAEALEHFASVRTLLGDELGVDPGRDLQDLHARLLRDDPGLAVARPTAAVVAPAVAAPSPLTDLDTTADAPRLIGRAAEAVTVRETVDAALHTGFRAATVVGEAGIGKTRLLEEAAAHARGSGAVVAWGRCWQHDGAPRMWPFVQVLRALAAEFGPAVFTAAAGSQADALAAVVPELLGERDAEADVVVDLDGSEVRVADAVAGVLARLATRRPVVLVLEDLHWADATSRRTVEYLVTHLTAVGVAAVLSVRWPSDEASAATGALLAALARGRQVRVDLGGFGPGDLQEYVADRTGATMDDATTAALLERTDGNPFFVGEIVRLVVGGDGTLPADADAAVPDSVRAVVLARLDRLDRIDRVVLDAAAVVGRSFDLDLLVAASGETEDVVDEAVDRATAAGIIATEPGHPGIHRFGHALVQQTLLESLGPGRRRRVHARVAAVLRTRPGPDGAPRDLDLLVHHLAAAGGDDALLEASRLSTAAAGRARRRGDWAQAESLLLRAVDLAARVAGDASEAELAARSQLFSIYCLENPTGEATYREYDRVVDLARRRGDSSAIAAVSIGLTAQYSTVGDLDRMDANAEDLGRYAELLDDDVLRIGRLLVLAQTRGQRGDADGAVAAADEGLAVIARARRPVPAGTFALEPRCALRFWRLFALWTAGRDDAVAVARADLARELATADPHTRLYTRVLLTELAAWDDDPAAAAVEAAAVRAARDEAGLVGQALLWIDPLDAWVRERLTPGAAMAVLDRAMAATESMPTMAQRPYLRVMHAECLVRHGRVDEARTAVQAGLTEVAVTGERSIEPALWVALAQITAAAGDDAAAREHRARAAAVADELGLRLRERAP